MPVDLSTWRNVIKQAVDGIADEGLQRRAWFGIGPEESSPDEDICQFLDDAAIEDFLNREDAGLNDLQMEAGRHLLTLTRDLLGQIPQQVDPSVLIDDPRWRRIREAAARFSILLATGTTAAG
jgi:hypothetical protein